MNDSAFSGRCPQRKVVGPSPQAQAGSAGLEAAWIGMESITVPEVSRHLSAFCTQAVVTSRNAPAKAFLQMRRLLLRDVPLNQLTTFFMRFFPLMVQYI